MPSMQPMLWAVILDERTKETEDEIRENWSFNQLALRFELYQALDVAKKEAQHGSS